MASKALVATKVGMTQQWNEDGHVVPVTVLRVDDCRVVQVKTTERDGYTAVQVTYGQRDLAKLNRPAAGHLANAGVEPGRRLLELRLDGLQLDGPPEAKSAKQDKQDKQAKQDKSDKQAKSDSPDEQDNPDSPTGLVPGATLEPTIFEPGELVDVTAISKGKGFAGVMKRHNFSGQRATHGAHLVHRVPGSIGACATPSRVFKGQKMPGRMGGQNVTTQNLQVVSADADSHIILLKGSVPGPKGGAVIIRNAVKAPVAVSA